MYRQLIIIIDSKIINIIKYTLLLNFFLFINKNERIKLIILKNAPVKADIIKL
ncbi:MAG: hypothetical protein V8Q71_01515 [Bacilli bacterium]